MSSPLMEWLKSPLPLKSLYYVVGTEAFFISAIKKTFIRHIHGSDKAGDFNHDEVSAGDVSIGDLVTLLETLPFMSEKRLVFCDKAHKFSDQDWGLLSAFLSEPAQSTVFVCFFEKKDGRKKHFKLLKEKAVQLSAKPLRPWELEAWLDFVSREEGLEFSSGAKVLFSQLVGLNLMEIQLELKKLKQYMGEGKTISEKDILSCTSRLKNESVFDLASAIGRKDIVQALSSLAGLFGAESK